MSIYLGNGQGGFSAPDQLRGRPNPTGLTVADLTGNGKLDLLVGDAYGDVLVLLGNGDGTFRPQPVKAAIALAVADLTGNGSPTSSSPTSRSTRSVVVYRAGPLPRVGQPVQRHARTPAPSKLADLNSDGIPDLIVANSGGNNVLVYPGLGNGQFGPSFGGSTGFPVGTDPPG